MKLHKLDTKQWTVREVEREPWPGRDEEGEACFDNTHYESADDAWEKLEDECFAGLGIAVRRLESKKIELRQAEQSAADMAVAVELMRANKAARGQ